MNRAKTSTSVGATTDALLRARPVWGSIIGGAFVEGETDSFEVLEAATGGPLARVANANAQTVAAAVADSRRAYEEHWRDLSSRERGSYMRQVAAKIREHADELAELCAREVGKPKRDALCVDVVSSHTNFDYYAGIADTVHGEIIHQGPVEARVAYEPYGVVAAILPFNWPVQHLAKKCAPAIAVGNTVVVKPGEQAPLAILRLIELANEVLPPGVINAVNGMQAGPALIANPRIERVIFTGSTATGRKVMQAAAEHLTFVTLEFSFTTRSTTNSPQSSSRPRAPCASEIPSMHLPTLVPSSTAANKSESRHTWRRPWTKVQPYCSKARYPRTRSGATDSG